jgi:putative nucleotidyltransferase with HDIG domain
MVAPGQVDATAVTSQSPVATSASISGLLEIARRYDRKGYVEEAAGAYEAAILAAEKQSNRQLLAEALRRHAVLCHRRGQVSEARELCQRSYDTAVGSQDHGLTAEALNTLAGFELVEENYHSARETFRRALSLDTGNPQLTGRIQQNLGTVESVQGNHDGAFAHYQFSLDAFLAANDEPGCALAYHNLGVISAERKRWADADRYFQLSLTAAEFIGDTHLRGLGLLNRSEVLIAFGKLKDARFAAEAAVSIFDELRSPGELADAYRTLGVISLEAGDIAQAGMQLRRAIAVAGVCGSALSEAQAMGELARLYGRTGRIEEAVDLLATATRELGRLRPCLSPGEVVEGKYPALISNWGELVRMVDRSTFEHDDRVAAHAVAVARALELDETAQATIRVGAFLHDCGKIKVPAAILNKPGPLTGEELAIVRQHTVLGAELLSQAQLPWDVVPIVRWHHERIDGTGYPDGLRGEAIPIAAQIVGMVDVYDAMTAFTLAGGSLSTAEARARIDQNRHWWQPEVYQAFERSLVPAKQV